MCKILDFFGRKLFVRDKLIVLKMLLFFCFIKYLGVFYLCYNGDSINRVFIKIMRGVFS